MSEMETARTENVFAVVGDLISQTWKQQPLRFCVYVNSFIHTPVDQRKQWGRRWFGLVGVHGVSPKFDPLTSSHDPPRTNIHTQLHHFISKLFLYTCNKHVAQQTDDSGYSKSILSFGHLTGLMETPLIVHHISHLLEIGSFPWGGGMFWMDF